ncbi:hypothetical protein, variant [Sphaeroforma arctica JP610]|uniref:Fanconi-associated nuclease n=1 Tax=Sphaeroforma arctica JP610 TaxID=667725 RepID=A0A0L0G6R1_9EUKA|nr:hypothetical protein, variant [Sphaeroforma arctica JP610]KNC84705.1 hypothetical protein, variant [Sphaeroforma arctica JP610]|eukprot:XP_014158608.1 hypothetical protein, variant [Sphaeroforma arctica JP610]
MMSGDQLENLPRRSRLSLRNGAKKVEEEEPVPIVVPLLEKDYICVDSLGLSPVAKCKGTAGSQGVHKRESPRIRSQVRSSGQADSQSSGNGSQQPRVMPRKPSAAKDSKKVNERSMSVDNTKSEAVVKGQSVRASKDVRDPVKRRRSAIQQPKLTTFFTQVPTPSTSRSDTPVPTTEPSVTNKRAKHAPGKHSTVKGEDLCVDVEEQTCRSTKKDPQGLNVSHTDKYDAGHQACKGQTEQVGDHLEVTATRSQSPTRTNTKHMPPAGTQLEKTTDARLPKSAHTAPNWGCMVDQRRRAQYMTSIHSSAPKKGGLASFFSEKVQQSDGHGSGEFGEDARTASGPWIPYCQRSYGHRYENHFGDRRPPGVGIYDTDAVRAVRRAGAANAEPNENEPEPTQTSDSVEAEEPVNEPKEKFSDILAINMRRLLSEALKPHFRGILPASQISDIHRVLGLSHEALVAFVTIYRADSSCRWLSLQKKGLSKVTVDSLSEAGLVCYLGSPAIPALPSPDYNLALAELSSVVSNLSVKQLNQICKLAKVKTTRVDDPNKPTYASWKGGAGVTSNYGSGTNPRKADYARSVCESAAAADIWPFLHKKKSQLPNWLFQLTLDMGVFVRTTSAAQSVLAAHRLVLAGSSYIPDDASLLLNCGLVWDSIKFLPLTRTPKHTEPQTLVPASHTSIDVTASTHTKKTTVDISVEAASSQNESVELLTDSTGTEQHSTVNDHTRKCRNVDMRMDACDVGDESPRGLQWRSTCWHGKYHSFKTSSDLSSDSACVAPGHEEEHSMLVTCAENRADVVGEMVDTTDHGVKNQCTVEQSADVAETYVCVPSSMWTSAEHFQKYNEALDLSDELELYTAIGQGEPLYSVMHKAADTLLPYTAVDLTTDDKPPRSAIKGTRNDGVVKTTHECNGGVHGDAGPVRAKESASAPTDTLGSGPTDICDGGEVLGNHGTCGVTVRPLAQPYDVATAPNRPDMRTQHTVDWSRLMCRTVYRGAGLLQKEKKYTEAKHYLDILLRAGGRNPLSDQEYTKPYPWGTVLLGDIWCRYGRILERLGAVREAIDVYERSLKDQYVVGGQRIAIHKSVAKLSKAPYRWKAPVFETLTHKFVERTLVGERVVVGGRVRFNGSPFLKWPLPLTGGTGGVEEYSRQRMIQILDTPTRKWKGMHAENGVMFTIFGLMTWDVILDYHAISDEHDSRGHFYTTLQDMPACLYDGILSCSGLGRHVTGYLDGLTAVCEGNSACKLKCGQVSLRSLLTRAWKRHNGQQCKGIGATRVTLLRYVGAVLMH